MQSNITLDTRSISEIKTHPTFEQLFPIRPEILAKIEEDMRTGSYDLSQPIILATWPGQEEPVCIDGHTRLQASTNAGIEAAPVWVHEFDAEQEALEKAISLQRHRRNMSDAEIMVCVAVLDSKRIRGGDRRSEAAKTKPSNDGIENSRSASAKKTAELLGVSTSKVERTRAVLDHADPQTVEAVKQGTKSIHKACTETQKKRREAKGVLRSEESSAPDDEQEDKGESVMLTPGHRRALRELGGSLHEHVGRAIDRYLFMLQSEDEFTNEDCSDQDSIDE